MGDEQKFDFDVAFSFLSQDEALALEIADHLLPLNVFVYSKAQEALVGKDAIEEFSVIFGRRSRVNVILYRDGWGNTKVTAIEQHAIKQRCFEGDWGHMVTVNVVSGAATPTWMEPWKIWFDYLQYPIEQLIGAIKTKVLERGGQSRKPTAIDVGSRLAQERAFAQETRSLFDSQEGVKQGNAAAARVFQKLVEDCETLREAGMGSRVYKEERVPGHIRVQMGLHRLALNWRPAQNSVYDVPLDARIWTVHRYTGEAEQETANLTRTISRNRSGIVWVRDGKPSMGSDGFADLLLRTLIELHESTPSR